MYLAATALSEAALAHRAVAALLLLQRAVGRRCATAHPLRRSTGRRCYRRGLAPHPHAPRSKVPLLHARQLQFVPVLVPVAVSGRRLQQRWALRAVCRRHHLGRRSRCLSTRRLRLLAVRQR